VTYDSAAAELTPAALAAAVMQAHDVYHMTGFGSAALAAAGRQCGGFGGSLIDSTDSSELSMVIVSSG